MAVLGDPWEVVGRPQVVFETPWELLGGSWEVLGRSPRLSEGADGVFWEGF